MAYDGPVSRLLNRRFSHPLAELARRAGLSPNQTTVLSTAIAGTVPALFALNAPRLAGVMIQFASIADGVDGDLARMTGRTSQFGAVFDAVTDRYADAVILTGMTSWSAQHEHKPATALIGFGALIGSIMVSYSRARLEAETGRTLEPALRDYASRDVRLLLAAVGTFTGQVYTTLVALAVLTNCSVAIRLARFYRASH